ncbi:MAG: hypothetical protein WA399_02090 [Acidobacteriaceae bacterium]
MSRAYTEQVSEAAEASEPRSQIAGWYQGAAGQLGLLDAWEDLSIKFERQVAQQEKQQSAYLYEEQQRELETLRRVYVFVDSSLVRAFLREHRALPVLLLDAVPWLKSAFGDTPTLQLQLMIEEGEPATLCGLVLWTGALESAKEALRRFDDNWWLSNCRRASGNLIFDIELR